MAPHYLDSLVSSLETSLGTLQPLSTDNCAPLAEFGDPDKPFDLPLDLSSLHLSFTNCAFEDSLLQGFSFSRCTIKNCKLVNCVLEDSSMIRSLAVNCEFMKLTRADICIVKGSTITDSVLRRCRLESCLIPSGPNVLDSQIIDSHLYSPESQSFSGNNRNKDWLIHLFDCEVQSSLFNNITAHENNKISDSNDCKIVNTPLALRNFPTEIRGLIFLYWIELHLLHVKEHPQNRGEEAFGSLQTVPPLIVALRGDQKLYNEVLEVVYKKAIIPLWDRSDQRQSSGRPMEISSMAMNNIRKLSLE